MDIGEDRETVQDFAREQGLTFPILLDETGVVAQEYRVRGIPVSFFIDREGIIREVHVGAVNEGMIHRLIQDLL